MLNNDVLRRVRYIVDFNDHKMMQVFASAGLEITREQLSNWLKKDDDADYKSLKDAELSMFLNGLINEKRGKREGEQPKPEASLNNNLVFRKLMIAFNLKSEDVMELFKLADLKVGKSELSAFFRKKEHKNYRECKAQMLRNFLKGLQMKYRDQETE